MTSVRNVTCRKKRVVFYVCVCEERARQVCGVKQSVVVSMSLMELDVNGNVLQKNLKKISSLELSVESSSGVYKNKMKTVAENIEKWQKFKELLELVSL